MFLRGMGFTFDDTHTKGVASPLSEMHHLIEQNPRNREVIFPYIGGQEVNSSPTHAHHRYVINFEDYPLRRDNADTNDTAAHGDMANAGTDANRVESWAGSTREQRRTWLRRGIVPLDYPKPVAVDWPEVLAIVESQVKPERMRLPDSASNRPFRVNWWRFGRTRPELRSAITDLPRILANSQVSSTVQFAFLPSDLVFAHTLNIYPYQTDAAFCALQSRPHETWAHFFGSSMKDDLRYTPSDCFETFPFPDGWDTDPALEATGQTYYTLRASLMVRNDEGMTKTYNRFHDPYENDPELAKLRDLHAEMDRAVLAAYGWTDIPTDCKFLLDYEIDEEAWGNRKKPYRYRWPDAVRDEVLARLLELNAQRAAEDLRAGRVRPGAAR